MKGQSGNSRGDDPGLSRGSDMAVSRTGGDTTPTVGPRASSSYSIMNHTFRVNARYSALKAVGKGSFGVVCSAADEKQGTRVAIKKIHPMAQHVVDAKHVLREIRLMRYLGVHPNIISLEDLFVNEHHDELYIVMELLDSDLHRIIQSSQALGDAHHRFFMYQLLKGLKFLHDNRIIHRDLKPGNILVTKNCQLKITDFGLARLRPMGRGTDPDDEVNHPMTEHVVTRWYRPPELMLCPDGLYGYAVDLWSVGCILAELLGRQPLFPGKNFVHQLTLIFDVVGSPEPHEVSHIRNQQAKRFLESVQDRVKVPYANLFSSASEPAVDLLEHLLVFDPPGRVTVDEALDHPYFQPLRGSDQIPDLEVPQAFEFDYENEDMGRVELRKIILQEVESFQRAQRKRDRQARAAAAAATASPIGTSSSTSTTAVSLGATRSSTHVNERGVVVNPDTDSSEQQQQLQKQRRRRRQAEAVAATAVTMTATSSAIMGESTTVRSSGRERAPVSAVSTTNQTACGTAAVRAGQGSHGHVSQPHRGASTAAPPPRNYTASDADMNNGSITDTNKFYPVAERVDNGRARMPPVEAMHDAPVRPPTMPGYQSRHCNINWGGGGHDERWIVGRQPRPHHGDRSQVPHCAGVGWLPPSNMLGPCESPVRVRRASESAAIAVGCRYHEGDGNMMHSLTGARHTSRLNGNDHHLGVGRGAEVMHSYMHQHQQPWARKRMSVHEVQDRFHRLNFERVRHGHGHDHDDPPLAPGMTAPRR